MDIKAFYQTLPVKTEACEIVLGNLDGFRLAAPQSFWDYLDQDMSDVVNGCGPGGLGDRIVPDNVYFLSIKAACKIHDWMFTILNDEHGFLLSNQVFLDNMLRINHARTKNKLLYLLRFKRIQKYYRMVTDFGRLFYYDNHVSLYENQTIYVGRMYETFNA